MQAVGEEPDPRFSMANERTFLAWIRTAIALMVAGLAVAEFFDSRSQATRLVIALPLVLLGAAVAFTSYGQWEGKERAMRLDEPLPVLDPAPDRDRGRPRGARGGRPGRDRLVRKGYAAERTALAWQRSALSLAAVGALALRIAERHEPVAPGLVTGAVALVAAAAMATYGRRRYREGESGEAGGFNRAVALAVSALGVAAALTAVSAFA